MKEFNLDMPLKSADLVHLQIGDIVYLNGVMFTGRVGFYKMLFEENRLPPIDIRDTCNVNFHCSPAVAEISKDTYSITSVTGTASFRFAQWVPPLLKDFGVKAIIGKGGMQKEIYESAFRTNKAVYLTTVGYGLGAVYGRGVKRVADVFWKKELGLAQAMWILEVENMGPFLVDGDTSGASLQSIAKQEVDEIFLPLYRSFPEPTLKRKGEVNSEDEEIV
jgi:L(+)-tartrate dehydratase beta subunit